MSYCFDNSPLSVLFKNYYRARFPSLWAKFDQLTEGGDILSTREVLREINDGGPESLQEWAGKNGDIFATPTSAEASFVAEIFAVPHFQQNIEQRKLLRGGKNADPFVIARARIVECPVVTMERLVPNAARIPNICEHFGIQCLSLEEFMAAEGWTF